MINKIALYNIKNGISLVAILFINFLFSFKYLNRVTEFALGISIVITAFYIFLYFFSGKINSKTFDKLFVPSLLILLVLFLVAFSKIPQETLNVDRWSVIKEFWDAYFQGGYPYGAKSNVGNYPGPMPFYFFMALPFYWIKEIGYFSLAGLIALILFILLRIISMSTVCSALVVTV